MPKKQKDGRYKSKVVVGHRTDGTPVVKWISGTTKAELERARQDVIATYVTGDKTASDKLLGDYAKHWIEVYQIPRLSPGTIESKRSVLNTYILPALGDYRISAIKAVDIMRVLSRDVAPTRGRYIVSIMRDMLDAAISEGIITRNCATGLKAQPYETVKERRILNEDERQRILNTIRTHPDGLLLAMLYYTGMRIGEVEGLTWGDIDLNADVINVRRDADHATATTGRLKTKAARRQVPICKPLHNMLESAAGDPRTNIWTNTDKIPSDKYIRDHWYYLMIDAGFVEEYQQRKYIGTIGKYRLLLTPHDLRHNFISVCYENGVDMFEVSKIVGHSSPQITLDIYTHLSGQKRMENRKKIISVFDD